MRPILSKSPEMQHFEDAFTTLLVKQCALIIFIKTDKQAGQQLDQE